MPGVVIRQIGTTTDEAGDRVVTFAVTLETEPDSFVAIVLTGSDDSEFRFSGTSTFPVLPTQFLIDVETAFVNDMNAALSNAGLSTTFLLTNPDRTDLEPAVFEASTANVAIFAPRIVSVDAAPVRESTFDTEFILEVRGLEDDIDDGDITSIFTPVIVTSTGLTSTLVGTPGIDPGPGAESYESGVTFSLIDEAGNPLTALEVTNLDNDGSEITVSPIAETLDEADPSATGSYTITLGQNPDEPVEVTVDGGSNVEISVDGGATFQSSAIASFAIGETTADILVRAFDDAVTQGGPFVANISHSVTSASAVFPANTEIDDNPVTILDNDIPFVTVAAVSNVDESDDSNVGSFEILLDCPAPAGGLEISYTVSGTASEGVDYAAIARSVTIAEGESSALIEIDPIADDIDEGDSESVVLTLTESVDGYRLGAASEASVDIVDDDTASVLLIETDGETVFTEGGEDSYSLVLTSDPGPDEVVRISIGAPDELTISGSGVVSTAGILNVRFDSDNWFIPQEVVVSRERDFENTGDLELTINHGRFGLGLPDFGPLPSVDVTVLDIDTDAGVTITPGPQGFQGFDGIFNENLPDTLTVSLDTPPDGFVEIRVSHDYVPGTLINGDDEPLVIFVPDQDTSTRNEALLRFDSNNTSQALTVQRVLPGSFDFGELDVDVTFEIVSSTDSRYAVGPIGIDPVTVSISPGIEADYEFTPTDGTDLSQPLVLDEGDTFDAGFLLENTTVPIGELSTRVSVSDGIQFTVLERFTANSATVLAEDVTSFDFGDIRAGLAGFEFQFSAIDDFIDSSPDQSSTSYTGQVFLEVLDTTTAVEYQGLTFDPIDVIINENDFAGVTLTETDGSTVAIAGSVPDSIEVSLDSQPLSSVTFDFNTGSDIAPIASFTVQPEDFADVISLDIAALLDGDDGDETVSVSYTTSSGDALYDGLSDSIDVFIPDLLDTDALADGLDTALDELQSITSAAFEFDLLFVDASDAVPDLIGVFGDNLVAELGSTDLEDPLTLVGFIEDTISSSFAGIPLLEDTDVGVEIGQDSSSISFDVELVLAEEIATSLNADFGIPALGLELDGELISDANITLGFGFGLDISDGFFLNAETTSFNANTSISLSEDFEASGSIGFLGLEAVNNEDDPTTAGIEFSLELADPDDDGRLFLSEINSNPISDLVATTFNAGANVGLDFRTGFGDTPVVFPSVVFNLDASWDALSFEDGEITIGGAPEVAFNDIGLDLGSFLTDFAQPIINRVDQYVDPFRPVVDALNSDISDPFEEVEITSIQNRSLYTFDEDGNRVITPISILEAVQRVPAFQELFDFNIQVTSFFNALDNVFDFIDTVNEATDLAAAEGEGLVFTLGDYVLDLDVDTFDAEEGTAEFETARTNIQNTEAGGAALDDPLRRINDTTENRDLRDRLEQIVGFTPSSVPRQIDFPVIRDVENLFGLLTGQDTAVSLFELNFPTFVLEGGFTVPIPILAPFGFSQPTLDLGGGIGVEATIGIGYDTQGFFDWQQEDFDPADAALILDGLFINDLRDGEDIDEISLSAEVTAGFTVRGIGSATGGLAGQVDLDFNDSDDDGRIRVVSEIGERFVSNPATIFNLVGTLSAFFEAVTAVEIPFVGNPVVSESVDLITVELENGQFTISTVFDGPISSGTVFFDANFNGVQDRFEPIGRTLSDGSFELAIDLPTFDINGNGVFDANEGQIIVAGGIDVDTAALQAVPFASQAGWEVVSPLTLLATALNAPDPEATQNALRAAFGLAAGVVVSDAAAEGAGAEGLEAFRLQAQIDNLLILGANTLGEPLDPTPQELFDNDYSRFETLDDTRESGGVAIITELGERVAALTSGTIDLTDRATLESIINAAATAVGVTPEGLDAALDDIVARNTAIQAVSESGEAGQDAIFDLIAINDNDLSYDFVRRDLLFRLSNASNGDVDIDAAVAEVAAAFDAPSGIDFTSFNAIDALESGDINGLVIYGIGNQINTTLTALQAITANPSGDLDALLDAIRNTTGTVDLTNSATIATLISASAPTIGNDVVDALADAVANVNAEIQAIVDGAIDGDDLSDEREAIADIQSFSQFTATQIYTSVATGIREPAELPTLLSETGATDVETDEDTVATANLLDFLDGITGVDYTVLSVNDFNEDDVNDGVGEAITLESGAIVTVSADGSVIYDPNGAFEDLNDGDEAFDVIPVTVSDGAGGEPEVQFASVSITGVTDTVVPPLNEIFGSANSGVLRGTNQADLFISAGAPFDRIYAEGGDDVFDFSALRDDPGRNVVRVFDFEAGETIVGIDLDPNSAGYEATDVVARGDSLYITLEGDNDLLILDGITSLDQLNSESSFADSVI